MLELTAHFADGRLSEERLSSLPEDRILEELTQISGIGPWTVHGALLTSLHRGTWYPWATSCSGIPSRLYYAFDHVPTEKEVTDIAAAWHTYGSLGVNLLFAAVELD